MIDLKPACERMNEVLAGVADDQLSNPSPCVEYTVGDLIDHVDQVCRGSAAVAAPRTSTRRAGGRHRPTCPDS